MAANYDHDDDVSTDETQSKSKSKSKSLSVSIGNNVKSSKSDKSNCKSTTAENLIRCQSIRYDEIPEYAFMNDKLDCFKYYKFYKLFFNRFFPNNNINNSNNSNFIDDHGSNNLICDNDIVERINNHVYWLHGNTQYFHVRVRKCKLSQTYDDTNDDTTTVRNRSKSTLNTLLFDNFFFSNNYYENDFYNIQSQRKHSEPIEFDLSQNTFIEESKKTKTKKKNSSQGSQASQGSQESQENPLLCKDNGKNIHNKSHANHDDDDDDDDNDTNISSEDKNGDYQMIVDEYDNKKKKNSDKSSNRSRNAKIIRLKSTHEYNELLIHSRCLTPMLTNKTLRLLRILYKFFSSYAVVVSFVFDMLLTINIYYVYQIYFFVLSIFFMTIAISLCWMVGCCIMYYNTENFEPLTPRYWYCFPLLSMVAVLSEYRNQAISHVFSVIISSFVTYPEYILNLSYILDTHASHDHGNIGNWYNNISMYNLLQLFGSFLALIVSPFTNWVSLVIVGNYFEECGLILSIKDRFYIFFKLVIYIMPVFIMEIIHFFPLFFAYFLGTLFLFLVLFFSCMICIINNCINTD